MSAVGIVVVTHGDVGADLVALVGRMIGAAAMAGIVAVAVPVNEERALVRQRIAGAIAEADTGGGVVVACDLHGSTPSNCAVDMSRDGNVVVVSGVNLPMLLKLATAPREGVTPERVAQAAVDTAVRSIRVERGKP
jgi:PTS system mannose-specific IIA component